MKIVFNSVDLKEMVQLFLEEHTNFTRDNIDVAIVDGQIHVGIDETICEDTSEPEVEQLELDFKTEPKKRRGRKPKETVVVEPEAVTDEVEEQVTEVAEEVSTTLEDAVSDLDEQLVTAADGLFDEPVSSEEEYTATPVDDVFDPSKPLFG